MKSLKIGNIKIKNPLFLAPMVDITDLAYRLICRNAGASMAYTEMLYTNAILHRNPKTLSLMKTCKEDKPVGIQITGSSIKEFQQLTKTNYLKKYSLVDLNCGCPSIKITGNKAGSYLLNNPDKISEIIKILKTSNKPVTAKIRLGFKKNNVISITKKLEKAGADALTLHPRLAIHGRSIPADHKETKRLREKIGIPLIANGDIFTPEKAEELLDIADAIMIARGAIGNPLIFKQILHYLKTGKKIETTQTQRLTQFQSYLILTKKHKLENFQRAKYLASNFIRNSKSASLIRQKISKTTSILELKNLIKEVKRTSQTYEGLNK